MVNLVFRDIRDRPVIIFIIYLPGGGGGEEEEDLGLNKVKFSRSTL